MAEHRYNPETAAEDNREPGIVVIQGSNFAKEMARHEQFPSKYGETPGNPYIYRPYPKMVYRADNYQGMIRCMAQVSPSEYVNVNEQMRAEEAARQFSEKCQRIVKSDAELQAALEMGFRESPTEAVEWLEAKQRAIADAAAERNYADRNMSEKAKAEAAVEVQRAFTEDGSHAAEVPEQPIKRSHSEAMKAAWAKRKAAKSAA